MASHSVQRRTAKLRSSYTDESVHEAQVGVPRGNRVHGLDSCTPQQHALRALLAVAMFNSNRLGAPPRDWGIHVLNVYTFHLSPRFNDIHIAAEAPWNVAWRIASSRRESEYRIPGLRAVCYAWDHTRFWHVPTSATFLVRSQNKTGERLRCGQPCPESRHTQEMSTLECPMSPVESSDWDAVPAMSPSAQVLLAALFTRAALKAPDLSWAIGGWHYPPRGVSDAFPYEGDDVGKMLWGSGDYWTLRWYGFPNPEFVASALTDPIIGLEGAVVESLGNDLLVLYGSARLRLREENRHMLGSTERVLEAIECRSKARLQRSRS